MFCVVWDAVRCNNIAVLGKEPEDGLIASVSSFLIRLSCHGLVPHAATCFGCARL